MKRRAVALLNFTYNHDAPDAPFFFRLDYFLVSETLMDSVVDNVIRDQVYGSDHCPCTLLMKLK